MLEMYVLEQLWKIKSASNPWGLVASAKPRKPPLDLVSLGALQFMLMGLLMVFGIGFSNKRTGKNSRVKRQSENEKLKRMKQKMTNLSPEIIINEGWFNLSD